MFEINGVDYSYTSTIINTRYGPETLVRIYREGQFVKSIQESMSGYAIVQDFIAEHRENEDA
jgi:hypothetical protein